MKHYLTLLLMASVAFAGKTQIANNYPGDSSIATDPNVILAEMFEQTTIGSMTAGFTDVSNVPANILFDGSVPPGSPGTQSCNLRTFESPFSANEDTYLYERFSTPITDSVFVRYYVKFNSAHSFHHSGLWIGGNNPAINYPNVHAGYKPAGDEAFHVGSEVRGGVTSGPQSTAPYGFFNYWMNMRQSTQWDTVQDDYYWWGNEFISPDPEATINLDQWNCIEIMVKMNNPVSGTSGELALWINGFKVGHYGQGFPNGNWNPNNFIETATGGTPFEGFQWRDDGALALNYIWIKNYATRNDNQPSNNDMLVDHLVVAKSYIGPISLAAGVNEQTQPALRIYPNPGNAVINFSQEINGYQLLDITGAAVRTETGVTKSIDATLLSDGIYFLQTKGQVLKIVVEH